MKFSIKEQFDTSIPNVSKNIKCKNCNNGNNYDSKIYNSEYNITINNK